MSDESEGPGNRRETLSSRELIERLDAATPDEQRSILRSLYETASETTHPDDWSLFAQASLRLGNAEQALDVIEAVVEVGDRARIRLASVHFHSNNFDLCRLYLRQVAEHGVTDAVRAFATQQLQEASEAWFGSNDGFEMRSLQLEALRELIGCGAGGTDDVQRFARMLIDTAPLDPELASIPEAVEVLEAALSRYGDDVCLLEMLAECLNRFDPKGKLEGVLESLRLLAPESDAFAGRRHPGDQDKRVLDARIDRLRAMLDTDNPALQEAILRDMHRVVAAMPSRLHYRFLYAAALAACGETDRALAQTHILAEFQSDSHDQHVIVADLYRRLGRADLARPHLNAAIRNASDEDDIADAMEMKEQLDDAL